MREALFERWAEQSGVQRPFQALCEMDSASRKQIAEMLNVDLSDLCMIDLFSTGEYEQKNDTRSEACLIIEQDRKGIQARSHSTLRTISPFAEDHTWREVLVSVIQEFKIECHVVGKTEEQLEAVIFDYFADQEWQAKDEGERKEIDRFMRDQPELIDRLKRAGIDRKKRRWVVNVLFQAAKQGGFNTYITAVKVAGQMNRIIGTKVMMQTVTKSLATVLRTVNVALWAWLAWDVLTFFFGSSRKRLIPVIALIHQHYLLEKLDGLDGPS